MGIKTHKIRLASVEMRFMRTAEHTLSDHKGKGEFMTELQIPQITEFIETTKEI
jgi:hypothetical protein